MRNIFHFINRFSNLLLFLVLQIFCIVLIVQNSKYHHSMFSETSNAVTGRVNAQVDKVNYYFNLKRTNDSLVAANELLYNKLKENYSIADSLSKKVVDTIKVDSVYKYRNFAYISGKVVSNSVLTGANYFVVSTPNYAEFKKGMGVVDLAGHVAGIVTDASGKYPVVMSLLHKDARISARLFRTGEAGTIVWDGISPNELTLANIPKSAKIKVGDSVITSGYTTAFPKGLLVGRIKEIAKETVNNQYKIKVQSATDFYNLEYVYGIVNAQAAEVEAVLQRIKNNEQ